MTTYTNIAKPTSTPYVSVQRNATNYPQYGFAIYGVNKYGIQNAYTSVSKPTSTSYTLVAKPT